MARDSYLRRIEQLEAEAAARDPSECGDVAGRLKARLDDLESATPTEERNVASC
jgi:hypothetical protein